MLLKRPNITNLLKRLKPLILVDLLKKDYEAEINEIPNIIDLVKQTDYNAKTKDIDGKYFITSVYNKLMDEIL